MLTTAQSPEEEWPPPELLKLNSFDQRPAQGEGVCAHRVKIFIIVDYEGTGMSEINTRFLVTLVACYAKSCRTKYIDVVWDN